MKTENTKTEETATLDLWTVRPNPHREGIREATRAGFTDEPTPRHIDCSVEPEHMLPEDACGEWCVEVYGRSRADSRPPICEFGEYTGDIYAGIAVADAALAKVTQ